MMDGRQQDISAKQCIGEEENRMNVLLSIMWMQCSGNVERHTSGWNLKGVIITGHRKMMKRSVGQDT
jgi:hypothetical protein